MVAQAKKTIIRVSLVLTWAGVIMIGMVSIKLLIGLALYTLGGEFMKEARKL